MYTPSCTFHDVDPYDIPEVNNIPPVYTSTAQAASCWPRLAPAMHKLSNRDTSAWLVAGINQSWTYPNGNHTAYQMSCASAIGACCSDSGHACEHSCSCSKVLRRPLPAKQDAATPSYIVEVCSCSCIGCGCTDPEEKLAYLGDWTPTFSFR